MHTMISEWLLTKISYVCDRSLHICYSVHKQMAEQVVVCLLVSQ